MVRRKSYTSETINTAQTTAQKLGRTFALGIVATLPRASLPRVIGRANIYGVQVAPK